MNDEKNLISELFEELLKDSPEEKDIMNLILEGANNKEIVDAMLKKLK